MKFGHWACGLGVWVCMLAFPCLAKAQQRAVNLERFERTLERIQRDQFTAATRNLSADQRAFIDYGGYLNFNFLSIDDTESRSHLLRQTTLNAFAQINLDGAHEFYVRASTTYTNWNAGDSFDGEDDDFVEPTLDRAYYQFNLAAAMLANQSKEIQGNLTVKAGRQLVHWVSGLVLSSEVDGGVVNVELGDVQLTALGAITRNSIADFDSSRPNFAGGAGGTQRVFYGGMVSTLVAQRHRPFVYGLVQEDRNDDDPFAPKDSAGDTLSTTRFDYSSYYIGAGSTGSITDRLLYTVEVVYEGGEGLSDNPSASGRGSRDAQTQEKISAWAADVRLDYLLSDENNTRFSFELIIASGDDDRAQTTTTLGGNTSGSADRAFNAFGLINTGVSFSPVVSNLILARLGASTYPMPESKMFKGLQVGTNLFVYHKYDNSAPSDEEELGAAVGDSAYLGSEVDLFVDWQMLSDVTLNVRYGVFFPGDGLVGKQNEPRHFIFTGLTWAF